LIVQVAVQRETVAAAADANAMLRARLPGGKGQESN